MGHSHELILGNGIEQTTQNNLLTTLKAKAISVYTELLNASLPITAAGIKAKLTGSNQPNTTLPTAINAHNAHIKRRVGIDSTKATLSFVVNFEQYLKTQESISHNTTIKYIQFLKRIINH